MTEEREWLTERSQQQCSHLRGVAYRMLGSVSEADDALQEAWLRIRDQDPRCVENMQTWLTTGPGGDAGRAPTLRVGGNGSNRW